MQRRELIKAAGIAALAGPRAFAAAADANTVAAGPYEWRSVPFGAGQCGESGGLHEFTPLHQ